MEISELKKVCEGIFKLKDEIEVLQEEVKQKNIELMNLKKIALTELEKNEIQSFDSGFGKISKLERRSVKCIDKYEFMDWLDQKGILKESLNVPAQTVTRIYNEEYEHALVNKNIDFLTKGIPGLGEPSVYVDIRILRKK